MIEKLYFCVYQPPLSAICQEKGEPGSQFKTTQANICVALQTLKYVYKELGSW